MTDNSSFVNLHVHTEFSLLDGAITINKMIEKIDWCEVLYTNFSEKNLGCGPGPATAINWALKKEDKLIIARIISFL